MTSNQENPFEGSALTAILVVSSIEKSKKFYIEGLGASLYREYGGTSVVLNFLENWMLLVTQGEPTEDKPGISFLPPESRQHVSHSFTIRVKNCQRSYETLKARGIDFITPPVDRGSEVRCFFCDPDGHLFEISEYRESL